MCFRFRHVYKIRFITRFLYTASLGRRNIFRRMQQERRTIDILPAMNFQFVRLVNHTIIQIKVTIKIRQTFRCRNRCQLAIPCINLMQECNKTFTHHMPSQIFTFFIKELIRMNKMIKNANRCNGSALKIQIEFWWFIA